LKQDLIANTGRSSLRVALSAFAFHPGFATITIHRLAQACFRGRLGLLGRLTWRFNVMQSGCHFHPDSVIGPALNLPHATGIVIGQGARVGANVTIYHNVTLGRGPRVAGYPQVGDGVVIFPGATLVGDICIGRGAVIGAGTFVDFDVADGETVRDVSARQRGAQRA
jgi:serine O-acetyltransferase